MKQKMIELLGADGVLICSVFVFILGCIAICILSLKAYAENLLPETPHYVNDGGEPVYERVTATGYSPTVTQTDSTPFITATNKRVRFGIVAVSENLKRKFPMNSSMEFWIEGKKYLVQVEDKMNKRKRNQIDIFFWKTKDAEEFGVHRNILIWKVEDAE